MSPLSEAYATTSDVVTLFRSLTDDETTKCEALLPLLSDQIRVIAAQCGQDFDERIEEETGLDSVTKAVIVGAVSRILRQSTTAEPMVQESQGGLGYTWSGTYAVPGGGIVNAFLKTELRALGLRVQRMRSVEYDFWSDSDSDE